jgi:AcrR family transcriptional regulator
MMSRARSGRRLNKGSALPKPKSRAAAPPAAKRKPRSPAARRKRRSPGDVLNRIVQAATEEFKRNGFAGTTTAAIARRAEVTEAQLFRYFGSKSNLFRETVFKPLDQFFLDFIDKHTLDPGRDARVEMTNLYTSELQHFIRENSGLLISLVVEQAYDPDAAHGVGKINSLGAYFDRGAALMSQRLKKPARVEPRLMVRLAFVSVLASVIFKDWIFPEGLAADEQIEAAINVFVREGIGANQG